MQNQVVHTNLLFDLKQYTTPIFQRLAVSLPACGFDDFNGSMQVWVEFSDGRMIIVPALLRERRPQRCLFPPVLVLSAVTHYFGSRSVPKERIDRHDIVFRG